MSETAATLADLSDLVMQSTLPEMDESVFQDVVPTIRRMYAIQQNLNRIAGLPHDGPDILLNVLTALKAENNELLNELKPLWAWWSRKDIDPERVIEEHTDTWFFYLSLIDIIDTRVHSQNPELPDDNPTMTHLLMILQAALEHEDQDLINDLKAQNDALRTYGMFTKEHWSFLSQGVLALDLFVAQLQDMHLQMLFDRKYYENLKTEDYSLFEILMRLSMVLLSNTISFGLDMEAQGSRYRSKALVNINRWIDSGVAAADDELVLETLDLIKSQELELTPPG